MTVEIISSPDEVIKIKEVWMKLEEKDTESTIFQSFSWSFYYIKYLLGKKKLRLYTFYFREELISIFPMQIREDANSEIIICEFLGSRGTDYLMPLTNDVYKNDVYKFFYSLIFSENDNFIYFFEDLPEKHSFYKYIVQYYNEMYLSTRRICPCYCLELPNSWEEYLSLVSKRMRRDLQYDRNYLERKMNYKFCLLDQSILPFHIRLNQQRMHSKKNKSPFDDENAYEFWSNYFTDSILLNNIKYYAIVVESEILASVIMIEKNEHLYIVSMSMNVNFAHYSPGNILIGHIIEKAIYDKVKYLDFSRGKDSYKLRLCTNELWNTRNILCKTQSNLSNSFLESINCKIGFILSAF